MLLALVARQLWGRIQMIRMDLEVWAHPEARECDHAVSTATCRCGNGWTCDLCGYVVKCLRCSAETSVH